MNQEEVFMRRALQLAERGRGWTSPNPVVGAVIVREGEIIGEGWHERYGGLHAERNALADCRKRGENPSGATLYVTLEPCCHYGKTPPCTEAIIEAGIKEVVVGILDCNPLVCGNGIRVLKEHKIAVRTGILQEECLQQNRIFFHYVKHHTPYVLMKYAMTLDGRIASVTGDARWITGEAARKHVHELRHKLSAIMVGVGTVLADDPMLNCRLPGTSDPIRIICDTTLKTPLHSKIIQTASQQRTIFATCCDDLKKVEEYQSRGCEVLTIEREKGHICLPALMRALGAMEIDSVLLEGGAEMNWSALQSNMVNEVYAYIAPKLLGGVTAKGPIGGSGLEDVNRAVMVRNQRIEKIGEDFLVTGYLEYQNSKGGEAECLRESSRKSGQ